METGGRGGGRGAVLRTAGEIRGKGRSAGCGDITDLSVEVVCGSTAPNGLMCGRLKKKSPTDQTELLARGMQLHLSSPRNRAVQFLL